MINSRLKDDIGTEMFTELQEEVREALEQESHNFLNALDPDNMGIETGQEGVNDGDQ